MGTVGREEGYALLDALIALALVTVTLSGVGLLIRGSLNRESLLFDRSAAIINERNTLAIPAVDLGK